MLKNNPLASIGIDSTNIFPILPFVEDTVSGKTLQSNIHCRDKYRGH